MGSRVPISTRMPSRRIARTIGTISGQVSEHGSNVHFKWQGMSGVYEAPESPTMLGLMAPVSSQATQVSDNLAEVSAALVAFAADVRPIKAELDSLRTQAQSFVDSIQGGVRVREINPAWTAAQSPYGGASGGTVSPSTMNSDPDTLRTRCSRRTGSDSTRTSPVARSSRGSTPS